MSRSHKSFNRLNSTLMGLDPIFALSTLPDRHQEVIRKRFGVDDGLLLSQAELADEMGVSPNRISQIEARSIGKLAALRSLHKPEKVFYKEKDDIYLDGGYKWHSYPDKLIHRTWEDD